MRKNYFLEAFVAVHHGPNTKVVPYIHKYKKSMYKLNDVGKKSTYKLNDVGKCDDKKLDC